MAYAHEWLRVKTESLELTKDIKNFFRDLMLWSATVAAEFFKIVAFSQATHSEANMKKEQKKMCDNFLNTMGAYKFTGDFYHERHNK